MIYHPKGKAGEYAEWALNIYRGCSHKCTYCYVPTIMHMTRTEFSHPRPRKGILENTEADAWYLSANTKLGTLVFHCFACDPYPHIENELKITRQSIEILHKYGLNVILLTKGGIRATRDFDLLTDKDQFGVTLTCLDNTESLRWESGATLPMDRIDSLREAHRLGIPTWASLEPVLNPETTLKIIRLTYEYVDMFKVGILNYHPLTQIIDWCKFGHEAIALLESLGKKYYIKADLQSYLR
ncbi:MAG: radical SAM protein [Dehalococcoidales bacterium]|nr:radical SAM protein [Dehalococcoidales bacterium]